MGFFALLFIMDKLLFNVVNNLVAKPEPRPRRTIRQVLSDFYYMSTVHGITHAANAPNRTIRIFWVIVFLSCMVVMSIQLWVIVEKFLQYPYVVQVDVCAQLSIIVQGGSKVSIQN